MSSFRRTIEVDSSFFFTKEAISRTEFIDKNGENYLIEVIPDQLSENPRNWTENLWTWVTTTGAGYSDKIPGTKTCYSFSDFEEDGQIREEIAKDYYIIPLGLYRHSGDYIYIGNNHPCRWDSGQMGYALVSYKDILDRFSDNFKKSWSESRKLEEGCKLAIQTLRQEIAEMNAYISGQVYGILIKNLETLEEESCWGFYFLEKEDFFSAIRDMLGNRVEEYVVKDIAGKLRF